MKSCGQRLLRIRDHAAGLRLHQPHAAGRSARNLAGADLRRAAAASPRDRSRDHDAAFRREWQEVKAANERVLAGLIEERPGTAVDPESLFDVQVKRLHEYKRQHLNVLY